jgi:hypothetical protein
MISKTKLYNLQSILFDIFIKISYILIFISAVGMSEWAPKYLDNLDYYVRIYVCLFLIWRFNPLRSSYEFTDLDRKITFTAGISILTTTVLNNFQQILKLTKKNIFISN